MTPAPSNTRIDGDLLWADLMSLAEITDPAMPYTRRSFSPRFMEGRHWLEDKFKAAGLTTRIDAGGNLIGRLEGSDPSLGTLMIGSHSDTVRDASRLLTSFPSAFLTNFGRIELLTFVSSNSYNRFQYSLILIFQYHYSAY